MSDVSEQWRPVVGWEGLYEVSDCGQIRSKSRFIRYNDGRKSPWVEGRILKPQRLDKYGHTKVCLVVEGVSVNRSVHSLVVEAFVGPRPAPDIDIRHLNGIAGDNRLENLAYGTKRENMQDMLRHGTNSNANKTHCKRSHEYTPENTYVHPTTGGRHCRTCKLEYGRDYYAKHGERIRAQIKDRPNYQDLLKKHREVYYPGRRQRSKLATERRKAS